MPDAPEVPDAPEMPALPEAPELPEAPQVPTTDAVPPARALNDSIQMEGGEITSSCDKINQVKNQYCDKQLLKFDNLIFQNYESEILKIFKERELVATKPLVDEIDRRVQFNSIYDIIDRDKLYQKEV